MIMSANDIAVIGVGLHPFGRFAGKSAMAMCADAIGLALTDAGVKWKDIKEDVSPTIGTSGLRQVHELVRQLRGEAGDRQISGTAAATILST